MNWSPEIQLFAGPTAWDVTIDADIVRRPPAAAGDLLARRHDRPCTLVLIDGYFDACRSPWHKEILALLAMGFRVVGAASMGALRAAELDGFGMIGAGAVYRGYRCGILTADDEVAITHAPDELGFRPLTIALVDVRAALLAERRSRAIDRQTARATLREARAIPFRKRTDEAMAMLAERMGIRSDAFLPGKAGVKARDLAEAIDIAKGLRHVPAEAMPLPPPTSFLRSLLADGASS